MTEERKNALRNLKTVRGQIDGIIKMIEDGRYCIDVSNQIMASYSLLKTANLQILEGHLHHCVKESFNDEEEKNIKIDEVLNLLGRMIK